MENCDNDQGCETIVPGTITPEPLPTPGEGGGTSDFNQLTNLPKYGGETMSGATDIPNTEALIPATASGQNQLADKNFVNSSVATNTANFVGTFSTIEELEAVQNPTNNDYGFVISTDASGNTVYNRYKYRASDTSWVFEYALNNSSFTADQWAAIQSGITSGDVSKLQGLVDIQGLSNEFSLDENNVLHLANSTTVVQTTGTSTTDVMSQDATTKMIYPNVATIPNALAIGPNASIRYFSPTNIRAVAIGTRAKAGASNRSTVLDIAIGANADTSGESGVAIGGTAKVTNLYSVALGYASQSARDYEVSVGSGDNSHAATYKERYLANVKDPSLPQDAATKNYVDTQIGNIETILQTLNSGTGASA